MSSRNSKRQEINETATFTLEGEVLKNNQEEKHESMEMIKQSFENDLYDDDHDSSQELPRLLKLKNSVKHSEQRVKHSQQQPNQILEKKHDHVRENSTMSNKALLTFNPALAKKMYSKQQTIQQLKQDQLKLANQMTSMNQMLNQMLSKKHQTLSQYEKIAKQKKTYHKLIKNLSEDYQAYQFMLNGDYLAKLEEEYEKDKKYSVELKKEVHDLNKLLSTPMAKNVFEDNNRAEKLQKESFDLQILVEMNRNKNNKKQQNFNSLLMLIEQKSSGMKQFDQKIEKLNNQMQANEGDDYENQPNLIEVYQQLTQKKRKLVKIRESYIKNKTLAYKKKVEAIHSIENNMDKINSDIQSAMHRNHLNLKEIEKSKYTGKSKSAFNKKVTTAVSMPSMNSYCEIKPVSHQNNSKLKPFLNNTIYQEAQFDKKGNKDTDRPELVYRRKRIYTELQKNSYFKNIENSENQKHSRMRFPTDVEENNDWKRRENQDESYLKENSNKQKKEKRIALPNICIEETHNFRHIRLKTEDIRVGSVKNANAGKIASNKGISLKLSERTLETTIPKHQSELLNADEKKASILIHNHLLRQRRNAERPGKNYDELCTILNRDKLLIEEDCEYEMSDLIYNSRY